MIVSLGGDVKLLAICLLYQASTKKILFMI